MTIDNVDICCGLAWGDEAKGKIVLHLIKQHKYDFVCRWSGGSNAGHTIYINGIKYNTNIIPAGVFLGINSYIGPDCFINVDDFLQEVKTLKDNGFDTTVIKISPNAHVITNAHKDEDMKKYLKKQGSTGKGIAPCARDKFGRIGTLVKNIPGNPLKDFIFQGELFGNILCEGAQGFWLDINYGNYPFVTSSYTLPYSSCSLGFPPQKINKIYGAAKIYDTRVGVDPEFPNDLLNDTVLQQIVQIGQEFGTTTGRTRIPNWLNLDKLIKSINITGTTHVIISKIDVLQKISVFKYIFNDKLLDCPNLQDLLNTIRSLIHDNCSLVENIVFSDNPQFIEGL